ncbi:MAG: hypothetical protein L0G85_00190 [Kocuria sp.]|nr:hypothetical protein [Kocuria sp.]
MPRSTTPHSIEPEAQKKTPKKARAWTFTCQLKDPLTGAELFSKERLQAGLGMKSTGEYLWHVEDQDKAPEHIQGALRMVNSRTREQVAGWLGLPPMLVVPLQGHGAFQRHIAYILGLSPEAVAKGKAHYPTEGIRSNFDWQACLESYFGRPAVVSTLPTLTEVKIAVFDATMSLADVQSVHKALYVTHRRELQALAADGEEQRRLAKGKIEQAEATEREARERPRREREALQLAEAARVEQERQQIERQQRERDERERLEAEVEARRLADEAERATPEYQARVAAEQEATERRDLVTNIAMWLDVQGLQPAREHGAAQLAQEYELTSDDHLVNGRLTHRGAVVLFADLCLDLGDACSLDLDTVLPDVRAELVRARADLQSVGRWIVAAEFHAADGNEQAFKKALRLRRQYATYTDVVELPMVRTDIKKSWRDALTNVDPRTKPGATAKTLSTDTKGSK